MPSIIPIKELKNTGTISEMCHKADEPIFVTKNGYSDMVVMSNSAYDNLMGKLRLYQMLAESEQDVEDGRLVDSEVVFSELRKEYEY
ncbi:MAG: type II toxin-antitoxin system prevent-host-death family antitoxin [Oscillospiraceae bacterium]